MMKSKKLQNVLITITIILSLVLVSLLYVLKLANNYEWIDNDPSAVGMSFMDDAREDRIIYWGYEGCPWCDDAKPVLQKVAKKYGLKVHYIQVKQGLTDAEKQLMAQFLLPEYADQYNDKDGNFHFYVPTVMVIKDGKLYDLHMGTLTDHNATERDLTEEEQDELEAIYTDMFKDVTSWILRNR